MVAGLGNYLQGDDGVGIHALAGIARAAPEGVETLDVGTAIWHLADQLDGVRSLLAIDAMRGGGAPGTLYRLDGVDALAAWRRPSAHGVGLAEMLQWLPAAQRRPQITVIGIEPECLDCGTALSPAVEQALSRVVTESLKILTDWTVSTQKTGVQAYEKHR